jgi:hypothetical protein
MHNRKSHSDKKQIEHPVFSDFSHIPSVGNISFAVGLRDDNAEANVYRILPLTKIVPALKPPKVVKQKIIKKVSGVVVEEEDVECLRADCIARRHKLEDLKSENENLRFQFKIIENKLSASKHKKALAEKTIATTEEKNDSLRISIEDAQNRMDTIEAEIDVNENTNNKLRIKLAMLEEEVENLRIQAEKDAEVLLSMKVASVEEMVFGPKRVLSKDEEGEAADVRVLLSNDEDDISEDDNE